MSKSEKVDFYIDASPSWNGYNHQGKVGLLVVLDMIKKQNISYETIKEYELELEWLEDFSIKRNSKYISIHQVKTYNSSAPSDFKEAIWILLAKLLEIDTIENAYLHTVKKMSASHAQIKSKLPKYTMKKSSDGKNIPFKSKKIVDESGRYEELFSKFGLYNYSNEGNVEDAYFCEMSNIEKVIKNKIQELSEQSLTSTHLSRVYYNLLGLIDNSIKEQHIIIQKKEEKKVKVPFEKIFKILNKNHESISEEYAIYKMRSEFEIASVEYINNYKNILKEHFVGNEIEINKFIRFNEIVCNIGDLSNSDFLKFSLKIMPDTLIKKGSCDYEVELSNALNKTNLQNCFFKILKEIEIGIDNNKWVYLSNNKAYLPSLINDDDDGFGNQLVLNRLFDNENPELLNEVDIIITKDITVPSINNEKFFSQIPLDATEEGSRKRNDRITIMKKVGLMKIDDARKELDNE